jgi:pyruvate kinase
MKRTRNSKIIATLGPASSKIDMIEKLFIAGADVFRLNFSHGSYEDHQYRLDCIRTIEKKYNRPIAILSDLQGPKLRVGTFAKNSITLKTGDLFQVDLDKTLGTEKRVCLPHPEIFAAIAIGTELLLDDGKIRLKVEKISDHSAETRVITGGELSNNKGLNVPNAILPLSALTPKDRADLEVALSMGTDWVALSFVQRPDDVEEIKEIVKGRAMIMSKLEKPSAIEHLNDIIALSDGIMIARGDLGVECPPESVPILQKRILREAHHAGKPVVVATQMLDSMVHAPTPTRAEASDVAHAIYDGADAVMLSAETAAGQYPVEAVTIMDHIIDRVEHDEQYKIICNGSRPPPDNTTPDAISAAARQTAHTLDVAAVVTFTSSGSTTLRLARERPEVSIICLTPYEIVARQMTLVWGVHSVVTPNVQNFQEMVSVAITIAQAQGFAKLNDRIVITAGVPFGTPGTTNILRVARIT